METLITKAGEQVLGLGLPGVIILGLAFGLYRMFQLYTDAQEKRITEGRVAAETLEGVKNALEHLSDIIRAKAA